MCFAQVLLANPELERLVSSPVVPVVSICSYSKSDSIWFAIVSLITLEMLKEASRSKRPMLRGGQHGVARVSRKGSFAIEHETGGVVICQVGQHVGTKWGVKRFVQMKY